MRLMLLDEDNILIYLSKCFFDKINFDSKKITQDRLKDLFIKIKYLYNIKIFGYYKVKIYVDNNFGYVISMVKEQLDYLDYADDQIDMRISIINTNFLYMVDDILLFYKDYKVIKYSNQYYLNIDEPLDDIKMGNVLEHSSIIYDKTNEIIKYGVVL